MWSPKSVNKIFPSQWNTNQNFWPPDEKFWSPIFLLRIRAKRTRLGPQWRFFCQRIRLNTNTLIIYTPTIEKLRPTNRMPTIRSFVRLPNVSSQLYTFSCLYLLEKKCIRLKNYRLVLCSMFKTIFPFAFCQDDRQIAMLLAPGHNREAFLVEETWR